MNAEKSRPCKCKRDRINHLSKMSMKESLQNMQVACFNEFGGTQIKLLIWAGHFYSRGTWYMGKTNTGTKSWEKLDLEKLVFCFAQVFNVPIMLPYSMC